MSDEAADVDALLADAAAAIRRADAVLVTAGAGMGVDSGLPDFRGTTGFWRAFPAFERLGLQFEELANPAWFKRDPHLAWGFYGYRLNAYRQTTPHDGFARLLRWSAGKPRGAFVFTSNVDAQFQRAGFDAERVIECHGSLQHLQCMRPCSREVWGAVELAIDVDAETMRAADPLPTCPRCGGLARPNVLMFGDSRWVEARTRGQLHLYRKWLDHLDGATLVVIECGAGTAVPSVRLQSEHVAARYNGTLVRINPREPDVSDSHIGIPLPAAAALAAIDALGVT